MKKSEKVWAYVSTRVEAEYAKAIAEQAAAENMSVSAWAGHTLSVAACLGRGLPAPHKPTPSLPPRSVIEQAAKAKGYSTVDEYMAAIVTEATKKDLKETGKSGEYHITAPRAMTPAKYNKALRTGTEE